MYINDAIHIKTSSSRFLKLEPGQDIFTLKNNCPKHLVYDWDLPGQKCNHFEVSREVSSAPRDIFYLYILKPRGKLYLQAKFTYER